MEYERPYEDGAFEVDLERQMGICQVEMGKEDLPGQRCRGGNVHTHLGH